MAYLPDAFEPGPRGAHDRVPAPITLESLPKRSPADPTVMSAVRYLLYRHEMETGTTDLPQTIAVVSDASGTGVTTVSHALSEVLASERSSTVLWIDATETHGPLPTGTTTLRTAPWGATDAPGARHWAGRPPAVGAAPISSLARGRLSMRNLGAVSSQPALDDLFKDLSTEFRHIVLDTPPILSKGDSIGFLRHADAYILVARHGSTAIKQIEAASNDLRTIPSMGAILNDYRTRSPKFIRRFFSE